MTVTFLVALCVPMLVSGMVAAQEAADLARIEEVAAAAVRDGSVAGLTIAVARGPRIVLERHYGRADLELDTPLPDNPVYEIGSVSKQFA